MIQLCRFKQINTLVIGDGEVLRDLTRFLPGEYIHPIVESKMDAALSQIQALPVIHGEIVRIRLESLDN